MAPPGGWEDPIRGAPARGGSGLEVVLPAGQQTLVPLRYVAAGTSALFFTVAAHTLYSAVRVMLSNASLVMRLVG